MTNYEEECPRCGCPMVVKRWYDDVGLVEEHKSCACGYVYHWSYGALIENGIPEEDDDNADDNGCDDICLE